MGPPLREHWAQRGAGVALGHPEPQMGGKGWKPRADFNLAERVLCIHHLHTHMCKQCPPPTRANMHLFTQLSRYLHVYGCEHVCARGGRSKVQVPVCERAGASHCLRVEEQGPRLQGSLCAGHPLGCPQEPAEPAGLGAPHPPHAPTSAPSSVLPQGRPGGGLLLQVPEVTAETITNWKTQPIPKGKHFWI